MPPDRLILGFDTSAAHCAAALLSGVRVVAQRQEPMARGQAERLFPLLEDLLAEADATWSDLTAIGVGTGPGNFTGIRISVAAARGLALSLDVPAIGISALDALALNQPRPALALIDARRGQFYAQNYGVGDVPQAPGLIKAGEIPGDLPLLAPEGTEGLPRAPLSAAMPLAEAIARIAADRAGTPHPHPRPAPLYLRGADAAPSADPPPLLLP